MKSKLLFLLPIIPLSTHAQITTDGTLGQALNLPGPDYQIGADLGQQRGGNLFHSFQDFNLQSFESATFSGPDQIQNVISRVTGGNPSNIDGTIRSTIPNADFISLILMASCLDPMHDWMCKVLSMPALPIICVWKMADVLMPATQMTVF
jgi:filamentous hemagglutinin family protein